MRFADVFRVKKCLLPYPEVIIHSAPPYCDCRQKEYGKYASFIFSLHYCAEHNVIVMELPFFPKDEDIFQITIQIIDHETLHWILEKIFGEPVSLALDNSSVLNFIQK